MTVVERSADDFEQRLRGDDFYRDPHGFYQQLRQYDPVYWSETLDSWVITTYDDTALGLRDKRLSNANRVATILGRLDTSEQEPLAALLEHFSTGLIHSDPPDHTRLRKLINKSFTPRAMEALRPRVQSAVDELLEKAQARGQLEVIKDLAFPLPILIIGDVLGVPVEDLTSFKKWCDEINDILSFTPTLDRALAKQESVVALRSFLGDLIAERRALPQDDLLSELVAVRDNEERLSEAELIQTCVTLMIAAHETTTNLIGNGLLALLRNSQQMDQLRRQPSMIAAATEELLRYDSPIDHLPRRVTEDIQLRGKRIRAGQMVTFSLLAANRDTERFTTPDTLDFRRGDNNHLAFGFGIHFCLGAPLARVEGQVALGTLLARFPAMELLTEPSWRHDRVGHGLKALEVGI